MKTLLMSAALAMGMTSAAYANMPMHRSHHDLMRHRLTQTSAQSDYRCGGISYGTGARSCGTASGGPVGGISSRN